MPTRAARHLTAAAITVLLGSVTTLTSCGRANDAAERAETPAPVEVETATVSRRLVARLLRVTGTLKADEQAEVSAEVPGRVIATPVERGTRVAAGDVLVRLSPLQASAQVAEAEATVAQSAATLDLRPGEAFDVERVPDVANARAQLELAEAEFGRVRSLLGQRVVSQSEFDTLRARAEAARQKLEAERNTARQRYRSYEAAEARLTLARKALGDTSVRAPFSGVVGERRVSVGDFVITGLVVAVVVRVDPLRLELTVPEASVEHVAVGQPVTLRVEAFPGREFAGTVRYVSPALRADQRALVVEAIVPNPAGALKPGFFATAEVRQAAATPALVVDARALRTVVGTKRVFVVRGGRAEERLVTIGREVDALVEVLTGLAEGEVVATSRTDELVDGAAARPVGRRPAK